MPYQIHIRLPGNGTGRNRCCMVDQYWCTISEGLNRTFEIGPDSWPFFPFPPSGRLLLVPKPVWTDLRGRMVRSIPAFRLEHNPVHALGIVVEPPPFSSLHPVGRIRGVEDARPTCRTRSPPPIAQSGWARSKIPNGTNRSRAGNEI